MNRERLLGYRHWVVGIERLFPAYTAAPTCRNRHAEVIGKLVVNGVNRMRRCEMLEMLVPRSL